jgi:hypothetical protein
MSLLSEQNIFFGNKDMGLCAKIIFFQYFKMTLKIHYFSESRPVRQNLISNQLVIGEF